MIDSSESNEVKLVYLEATCRFRQYTASHRNVGRRLAYIEMVLKASFPSLYVPWSKLPVNVVWPSI